MYKLPYFTEENEEAVFDFIQKNSFAIITGINGQVPVATHVPLHIKKEGNKIVFTGHMMKNTDHHKALLQNEQVLVIFTGAHCYVSASWYPKKEVASTWNYIDVHAHGIIKFGDEEKTRKIIEDVTNKYELPDSPAAFNKLPGEYVDRLVKAIIGFTIEVSVMENVFKLSQNHDEQTRENIIANLADRNDDGSHEIAAEMKKRF
ncbi:MAG: FMN-binding negative transcriptional regulator [Ginsengibacter sp.]